MTASRIVRLRKLPKESMTLEVTVRVTSEFYARIWVGRQLIRLAAWIIGCDFKIEKEKNSGQI